MYSICQTTHPSTTVEHSIECKFYNKRENNLVVAGSNVLRVYRIVGFTSSTTNNDSSSSNNSSSNNTSSNNTSSNNTNNNTSNNNSTNSTLNNSKQQNLTEHEEDTQAHSDSTDRKLKPTAKLELVQSFELYGTVASLQKVSLGNKHSYERDTLVMSFHNAKLSLVEYNPESHELKTISLHYFEDEALRDGCVTNHMFPPIVRADPENRCIAMLVYGRHIVVIPLDKDEEEDLEDELYNTSTSSSSFSLDHEPMSVTFDEAIEPPPLGQVAALKPAVVAPSNSRSICLHSYKIDLSEEICGEKIDNIVDIQFLYNYNDPTLVILHELARTWSGRVAMRQDTFSMVALSMNLHQRLQPIIWTVNNLPYDSQRILPVPKPIGGLLILACNELIYLNQSVPPFGMPFNSFTRDSSAFPLNNQDETGKADSNYINISLDLSQAVFLNHNKLLFILKDGDVYLVTLLNDDMRSIKNFHFERFASTVQPNCLTLCENDLLFIGSHVGDSILAEIAGDFKSDHMDTHDDLDDLDDSNGIETTDKKEPLTLLEHDRILSSSASGRICYGEASNISESLPHDYRDPYVELITTAGHHKNGSICVFQESIKPHVEDTYELKDCGHLWAVKPSVHSKPSNWRLLLNRETETMVFSTKGELLELKRNECAFDTSAPTVFAANIGSDDLTIQIMSGGALLISNDEVIDQIQFQERILDACIEDLQVIALAEDDTIYHVQLVSSVKGDDLSDIERQYGLACHPVGKLAKGRIVSLSLYKDVSGMFSCRRDKLNHSHQATYWLLTLDDRGVMEIFSVPDFAQVYLVDNVPTAPNILADNVKLFIVDLDVSSPKTKEIFMCGLGRGNCRPTLFIRSELELIIYETFPFTDLEITNHLKIRFKKSTSILVKTVVPSAYHQLKYYNHTDGPMLENQGDMLPITDGRTDLRSEGRTGNSRERSRNYVSAREKCLRSRHWLRGFKSIGGYKGVFLMGLRPNWIIMTDGGALRIHPMNAEGAVYSFSPYVDDNFIYYTENRELRIARLPSHLNLDSYWPLRKLQMNETVHFVNYHVERKIYCVVTSHPSPCFKIMRVGSEPDTMKIEELDREGGYIPPTTERFKLRLYDPVNWECIPDCEIEFEEWEQVTCVMNVPLASEGTTSGLKGYIAISTNYCYGEDVPNRGRIWILDLIEVVPEPDRPLTKNKIKKVYCQEQKGPVTTLSHTCGLLMSAVGQKIYLWQLKEEQLDGVAFIDTQIYIHCASSVKNLILVSDVCKSVSLLRYQQETRTLSMVCRDCRPLEVFACDFAVDNELLNFVVMDSEKNIIIYTYDPEHEESHGGTRLLRRADFHLGAHVTSMCRLRGKVPTALMDDPEEAIFCRRRHLTMFCTVDGAIGFIYPIHESVYQRLNMLQNEMTIALPHIAGLNPKAWRAVKQARPSVPNPCKLVIDGDLIKRFLTLSHKERLELTKKIGTSADRILADIQLIQESTLCF